MTVPITLSMMILIMRKLKLISGVLLMGISIYLIHNIAGRQIIKASNPLDAGRVARFNLDNSTNDTSGANHTTTLNGSVSYTGGSGGTKGVVFADNSSLRSSVGNLSTGFTVSLWLKSAYRGPASIWTLADANNKLEVIQSGNRLYSIKYNGQTITTSNNRSAVYARFQNNGRWFNLTFTYNPNPNVAKKCTFYLDGETDYDYGASVFECNLNNFNPSTLILGKNTNIAFGGVMDEVSVWNKILRKEDVVQYISETYNHYGDGTCEAGESSLNSPVDCKDTTTLSGKLGETNQYVYWWADPLIRVWNNKSVPTRTTPSADIKLAKNETRITQIALSGKTNYNLPLSNINLNLGQNASFLTGKVYIVENIPVARGSDNFIQPLYPRNTDPRPDAAVLLQDYQAVTGKTNLEITNGKPRTLIVELQTSQQAAAGNYTINLNLEGQQIPINVKVYNFTLPDTPTLPTLYNADDLNASITKQLAPPFLHGLSAGSNQSDRQNLIDAYMNSYSQHKIGPYHAAENTTTSNIFWNFFNCSSNTLKPEVKTELENRLNQTFNQRHVAVTEISHVLGYVYSQNRLKICGINIDNYDPTTFNLTDYSQYQISPGYEQKLVANFTDLKNFLQSKGWLDRIYFVFDEPIARAACGGADYLCVFRARKFHDLLAPLGFKVGPVLPDPSYFDTNHNGDGVIERGDWFNFLGSSENGSRERAAGGELYTSKLGPGEYWWYHTTHPAFNADSEANEMVGLYWQYFQLNIKGSLQWAFIGWDNEGTNPWTKLVGKWGGNGGIVFFYPPCGNQACSTPTFRVIPSVRLKLLREGINDHAYLTMLAQRTSRSSVLGQVNFNSLNDVTKIWFEKSLNLKNYREQVANTLSGMPWPTATPTPTPTITLPATPTPTNTPTRQPTPSSTPTATPVQSLTSTPTPSLSPTPILSPTPTLAESPTPSPTIDPSITPSPTKSPDLNCDRTTDLNSDGITDLSDLSIMLTSMGSTGQNVKADLSCDGLVDLSDLSLLLNKLQ